MVSSNPFYVSGYVMVQSLIDMGLQTSFYWMPFLLMALILRYVRWFNRQSRRDTPDMDDAVDTYYGYRETYSDASSRWQRSAPARRRRP